MKRQLRIAAFFCAFLLCVGGNGSATEMATILSRPLENIRWIELHHYTAASDNKYNEIVYTDSYLRMHAHAEQAAEVMALLASINDPVRVERSEDPSHEFAHDPMYAFTMIYNDETEDHIEFAEVPFFLYRWLPDQEHYIIVEDSQRMLYDYIRGRFMRLTEADDKPEEPSVHSFSSGEIEIFADGKSIFEE